MEVEPTNPWSNLPDEAPYVLPCDFGKVRKFNKGRRANDPRKIKTRLLPEPFLGNPDAPVVILGLNPGFNKKAFRQHRRPDFAKRLRSNLMHDSVDRSGCPLYLIDDVLLPHPKEPGRKWWDRVLRKWIDDPDIGRQAVAHGVFCVEFFPYHSKKFGHSRLKLKSQEYSFSLVRRAMDRDAVIVVLWGYRYWKEAIAELSSYPRLFRMKSRQNPVISQKNCSQGCLQGAEELKQFARQIQLEQPALGVQTTV